MTHGPARATSPTTRSGRLRLNATALVGARGLTVLFALAQVAVALPYLGAEQYGAWMLFLAVAAAIHVCDFGIGLATQQAITEALTRGEPARARAYARAGAQWLGGLGTALLILGVPLLLWTDWPAWCGLDRVPGDVRRAALAQLVLTALALPLNMAPRLTAGAQKHWIQALWGVVGSLLTLGWVAIAARTSASLVQMVAGAAAIAVLQNVGMALHTLTSFNWLRETWPKLTPETRLHLRAACGGYAIPQIGQALLQGTPSLALSLASGPAAVALFNLVQRLLSPFTQAQGLVLASLWPAYTEASLRGEAAWVRRKFRQSLILTTLLCLGLALVVSQAETIISLWTRQAVAAFDPQLAWFTAGWLGIIAVAQPFSTLLIGLGRWRDLAAVSALGYPLATAACFVGAYSGRPAVVLLGGSAVMAGVFLPALIRRGRAALASVPASGN